jgi:phosphomannomutase/phosphoglucomutase
MDLSIFRQYDIRGVFGKNLDGDVAWRIGCAYAQAVTREASSRTRGNSQVAVARDARQSSDLLADALTSGLQAGGVDVVDLGMCPTPLLYFALIRLPLAGGIVVTGSHNPPAFNGFKICRDRRPMWGEDLRRLGEAAAQLKARPTPTGAAQRPSRHGIIPEYLEWMGTHFAPSDAPITSEGSLRVVVDAGNGTVGVVVPELLRRLGYEIIPLHCEVDGSFPHHHPDPTVLENLEDLRKTVLATGADLGVAYDGDGDRLGVIDERGEVVWGDRVLILFARHVLQENPGAVCIGDVKCSHLFFREVEQRGGAPLMWKTGHSLIKEKMRETQAALAGEMSGHFFFADRYFGYDDAIYATARLLEILRRARALTPGLQVSDLLKDLPLTASTPEIRRPCPDDQKFRVVETIRAALSSDGGRTPVDGLLPPDEFQSCSFVDGVRITFAHGWGLVRASNTEPALILRFEAERAELLERYQAYVERLLDCQAHESPVAPSDACRERAVPAGGKI